MKKILLIILTTCYITSLTFAQNLHDVLSSTSGLSVIATPGLNRLDSDIDPFYNGMCILQSPSMDVAVEYYLNYILSVGIDFGVMMFNQEDNNERFIAGNIFTYNYLAADLINLVSIPKYKHLSLWARVGMGFGGLFRPYYATDQGHEYIAPLETRNTPEAYFIFPVGLALEYHLNDVVSLSLNGRYYLTNTDHLETVARGKHYDVWQNFGISIRYKFTNSEPSKYWSRY